MESDKERINISKLKGLVGQTVKIGGFIHSIRDQGNIKFLNIRDITGIIQVVVLINHKEAFELVKDLTLESVVYITGLVKEAKQAPEGIEIEVETIELLSKSDANLPIPVVIEKSGEETNVSARFDYRWVDLRKTDKTFIFKVWTELEKGVRKYIDKNGYVIFYPPSLMSAPSESGAEVFEVNYFDKKVYLAQSPQFYKQMAMAVGFEKVFSVGPVFRAEPSFTTRHMTEFTGWDFEISYIKDHNDPMDELARMLESGFRHLKDIILPDLEVPTLPFPKIKFADAKKILKERGVVNTEDNDVTPEEERELCKYIKETQNHDFVFLIDWPAEKRAFYHMRDDNGITMGYDLLFKGIEITTGAQREHRYDVLIKQAKERGMDLELLKFYTDFFKYGCPPHGGGGIGPGRIIMQILGLSSVKEAAFLPRDVKRVTP